MIVNPHIISQYIEMLQSYGFSDWANPTIGSYIRFFWLGVDKFWPQFLPVVVGGLWFIYYWSRRNIHWNWVDEMPIILFISILASSYSWTYDLVILVPIVIVAAIWIVPNWKNWLTGVVMILFIAINLLDLILHMKLDEFWFIWLAPSLMIWFYFVRWVSQKYGNKLPIPGTI
jgi:hypothetical protein